MNREEPIAGLAEGWGGARTGTHTRDGIRTQEQEQVLRRRVHDSPDFHLLSGDGWNTVDQTTPSVTLFGSGTGVETA
jgi:hypothetical protein